MSTPNVPTLKALLDRPTSTGPTSSTRDDSVVPSTTGSSSPFASPVSSRPSVSPASSHVARPSAFSIRNDFSKVQTRIRARSINSGKGVSAPTNLPQLEPTLAGSPVLPSFDSFLVQGGGGGGGRPPLQASQLGDQPLSLQQQREREHRDLESYPSSKNGLGQSWSGTDSSSVGRENGVETGFNSGTETASTRSDSPLQTPRDSDLETDEVMPELRLEGPSRRGSSAEREERELWKLRGETEEDLRTVEGRHRSKSLEGMTRMGLRRGRSFTSLLNQPLKLSSPKLDRTKELYQPPNPILESYESESKPPSPETVEPFIPSSSPPSSSYSATILYPPQSLGDTALDLSTSPTTNKSLRDFVPQLIILVALFFSSFAVIFFFISTLPGLFLPHSVADLPALTATLSTYRSSSFLAELHLFGVLTILFLWKQCFSIPGSVLTNILFGALYGTTMGTWWACLWTATGSTGAYLIAVVIAPLVEYYFASPLAMTRRALKLPDPNSSPAPGAPAIVPISSSDLFSHLLLARFFPLLPYSVLNVISGVLRLPLNPFFITLLIGSFPFNFATVSVGNLVALAASDPSTPLGDKIWSKEVVLKLVAVTLISVLPLAFKDQLKRILSNGGLIERFKDTLARMLFGFGSVPSTATVQIPAYPSGGSSSGGIGRRGWQRKFKASIGSASEFVTQGVWQHLGPGRRNPYDRVDSDVGLSSLQQQEQHHFAEGEDDAEMGGVL